MFLRLCSRAPRIAITRRSSAASRPERLPSAPARLRGALAALSNRSFIQMSARRKFYPEVVWTPACRAGTTGRAGPPICRNERIWNPPAVSGAGPNIVRTARLCQRVTCAFPAKSGVHGTELRTGLRFGAARPIEAVIEADRERVNVGLDGDRRD